jgi:hypothetical protein
MPSGCISHHGNLYISRKSHIPHPFITQCHTISNPSPFPLSNSLIPLIPAIFLSSTQTNPPPRFHLLAKARDYNGFDLELMRSVKILSATPKGEVVFELVSDERYGNLNGVMHGGAAGLIFDMCTTSALGPVARPGFWE